MPPILALLLYFGFAGFLLRSERLYSIRRSKALWVPTIWMIYIGSKPLARWLQPYASVDAIGIDQSGSLIDRLFVSVLMVSAFCILQMRRANYALFIQNNLWLCALAGYMLLSVLWTGDPLVGFKRYVRELASLLCIFVVATEPNPRASVEVIFRRTIYLLIPLSLVLIKYYPELGVQFGRWSGDRMWVGVCLQKNGLGRLCLLSSFFLIWTLCFVKDENQHMTGEKRKFLDFFLLAMSLYLLKGPSVQAYSATATIALLGGVLSLGILLAQRRFQTIRFLPIIPAITVVALIVGIALPFELGNQQVDDLGILGRDQTLTGRTEIWGGLIPDVQKRPLLGSGVSSFWTPMNCYLHDISEAHNGFLETILNLGVIGLILVAGLIISSLRKSLQALRHDYRWGTLVLCIIVITIVHNFTESSIHSFTSHLTAVFVLLTSSGSLRTAQHRLVTDKSAFNPITVAHQPV